MIIRGTPRLSLSEQLEFSDLYRAPKFVESVLCARKIVVGAVCVNEIKAVIDGNEPDTVLRESEVGIEPSQSEVTTRP